MTATVARPSRATVVTAIVVTYTRQDFLPECLRSIEGALRKVPGPTEIVVVDNGSPGNTATPRAAALCPSASVVSVTSNRGYVGGLSAGLAVATGEWILTIGDDASIEASAARRLLDTGSGSAQIGSVAAKMLFANGSGGRVINSAGLEIDRLGNATDRFLGEPESKDGIEATEVFGTSGGAALYRRMMLDEIGGFDESFESYLEDADVAWRARSAGWRCMHEPGAVVWHHHSATTHHRSDYKYFQIGRNRVRILAKNATTRHLARWWPLILLYDLAYVAYALVVDRTTAPIRGRLRGLREWRRYRAGSRERRTVELVPPKGLLSALRRNTAVAAHQPAAPRVSG